ncbi:MAG: tyrosine-type recombinase/integrase [Actinomycetota bacterium]|nr:tyrosine-type recombinase/integrase [Actinomycetota bacterium]
MAPAPVPARLSPTSPLAEALDAWMSDLGASKPSPHTLAAYRRDIAGIAGRLAERKGHPELQVCDLDRSALRAAFASWASDHATASVRRAHSAWSGLFEFLVSEGILDGSPMPAIPKPKTPSTLPRSIRGRDALTTLLRTAAVADPRSRNPWPERDVALLATFCVTGIREAEATALDLGSVQGEPGAAWLEVVGKGGKERSVPIDESLEALLDRYLVDRRRRELPGDDLDHPSTAMFVDVRARRMSVDQVRYLVEHLYVRAGIRSRVPAGALVHALRHTFATSALQAGADVVELQELLGHASLETTRRYLSATAQGLRHVIRAHPSQEAVRSVLDGPDTASGPSPVGVAAAAEGAEARSRTLPPHGS